MSAYDLLIRDGLLVDDRGARPGDVAVREGKIAAIAAPGVLGDADRTLSAEGQLVLPGGIDAHVHFDFRLGKLISQPYGEGSQAALYGGTTTIVDFAFRSPEGGSLVEAVNDKRRGADGEICCDYALHLIVTGAIGDAELSEVEAVVSGGVTTVKLFMNFPEFYPGDGAAAELFAELGRTGGIAVVHAENADVITARTRRLLAAGLSDWRHTEDSRPDWVESEAVSRAIDFAASGGCPLFVLHVTCESAAREIAAAQARGLPVFAECCHNYVVFSKEDVVERPDGANWGNYPPLRPPDESRRAVGRARRRDVVSRLERRLHVSALDPQHQRARSPDRALRAQRAGDEALGDLHRGGRPSRLVTAAVRRARRLRDRPPARACGPPRGACSPAQMPTSCCSTRVTRGCSPPRICTPSTTASGTATATRAAPPRRSSAGR